MTQRFPTFKAGHIFNTYPDIIDKNVQLKYNRLVLEYPSRIDAMAINPAAVCYNDDLVFTPGEIVISVDRKIKVKIEVIDENGGELQVSNRTQRKVLVKHAYKIITKTLNRNPSIKVDVDSSEIIKHSGFGSSSSTITAVSAAINELYGCPLENEKLIKFLASNHGEEVDDDNEEDLKMVQCIGGGATNGLTEEGIIIIAGKATTICKMKYKSDALIAIPKAFQIKSADELMRLEEDNLWKFKKTGDEYSQEIAYKILHKALPDMCNASIKGLADIVFEYRFKMGSIENCSFVYEGMINEAKQLRSLYEDRKCELLTLSSVGPAFFAIVKNEEQKQACKIAMENLEMNVIETKICNSRYKVIEKNEKDMFWKDEKTAIDFNEKPVSDYIVNAIDEICNNNSIKEIIDVGCGGGRYSRYLKEKGFNVCAVDKYKEMARFIEKDKIDFIQACMNRIPKNDSSFDMLLSIGVIHNATTRNELENTIKEFNRLLKKGGYLILSLFTNDVITDDLKNIGESVYKVKDRPDMVLLSKEDINNIVICNGFQIEKIINEHITDVGIGKRNVYSVEFRKKI